MSGLLGIIASEQFPGQLIKSGLRQILAYGSAAKNLNYHQLLIGRGQRVKRVQ